MLSIRGALTSGAGLEKFREIIRNQGGDPAVIDDYARLPTAPDRDVVVADRDGVVTAMKAEAVGRAAVVLGAIGLELASAPYPTQESGASFGTIIAQAPDPEADTPVGTIVAVRLLLG